jgi:hypothetical protein
MGDSYYPAAYGGGRLDFSGIESLGDSIGGAITNQIDKNRIRAAWEEAGGDYNKMVQNLYAAGDTKSAAAVAATYDRLSGGSGGSVYGTPIWGKDTQTGKEGVGVITKDGGFQLLDTGGFQPERGVTVEDLGYAKGVVGKGSGDVRGVIQQTGDLPQGYVPPPNYQPVPLPPANGVAPATQPGELPVYGAPQPDRSAGAPGTLPQGYATAPGVEPPPQAGNYMPGTEQARKEAEVAQAEQDRNTDKSLTADIVTEDIGRARAIINGDSAFPAYGLVGAMTRAIPQTPAHDVGQLLEGVKANISFDKLQNMRNASKTGAALGPVSDFENRLLQSVFGSLQQSQTKEQLDANLRRLDSIYKRIIHKGIRPGEDISGSGPDDGWTDLGNGVRIRQK